MKKMFLFFFIVIACVVILNRLFPYAPTAERAKLNQKCRQIKPGMDLSEVNQILGEPNPAKPGAPNRYSWGTSDYRDFYGGYIIANVNAEGAVSDLTCGSMSAKDIKQLYKKCMQLKPGVTLPELIQTLGEPREEAHSEPNTYSFGPYMYSVFSSSYIYAKVSSEGVVTELSCGENAYPWGK